MLFLCAGVVSSMIIVTQGAPSRDFPLDQDIRIEEGLSHSEIADRLASAHVVRSAFLFHMALLLHFENEFVQAGIYRFPEPLTTLDVAEAVTQGRYKSPTLTLMLPEGFSVRDLYAFLPREYEVGEIRDLTQYEGKLFPDTYFISPDMPFEDILALLQETMIEKLAPYEAAIASSTFTRDEVLTLASILEREANDPLSMKTVSGILQNRLEIGMPLQVDATLDYLLGKTSAELTGEDLEIDSPFNTYEYRGLPPQPIANPGLVAIEAVLDPIETDYLYYLTGKDGAFYYARTFEEHKANKERYLR